MLTNEIQDINITNTISIRYANVVYNKMLYERYGINSCYLKSKSTKDILNYEKMILSKMIDGDCRPTCKCEKYLIVPECPNPCKKIPN
jgi:hypothetical protein